ncbi:phosphoglucomutase [Treponema sp. R8-4-B8]
MIYKEIKETLDKMILSASGWRGVFADGEESRSDKISKAHNIICACAAFVFAEYLKCGGDDRSPIILFGTDTRPTGKAIADAMLPVLLACGCDAQYAGITAAPEIMAWAKSLDVPESEEKATQANNVNAGFIYISASHNPIGHNGIKFGLTDGGVLAAEESAKLIAAFRAFLEKEDCVKKIEKLFSAADTGQIKKVFACEKNAKARALKAYYDFCGDVAWGANLGACDMGVSAAMKDGLLKKPLGIVCDFNGSARTVSVDKDFFTALGVKFECINDKPGQIAHRIVPEGESLIPCCKLLEDAHKRDSSFILGYVPDCDGDRGNLVIWDDTENKARPLEAQEVFALACTAEFSQLVWTREFIPKELSCCFTGSYAKAAVAVNDPTSMRIDKIAKAFGISVFRAEVGEANVVSLARNLREEGYLVRILGEGSAGGNITHPSAVRDPVSTVLAVAKMLSISSTVDRSGLFEIWLRLSNQTEKYREDFTLADIIASLPPFVTTPVYNKDAVLQIKTKDHGELKNRYQEVFLREWDKRKEQLKQRFGICSWEAIAYNGTAEKRNLTRFGEAGRGGLKILFFNGDGTGTAYIWMRGSATEPVFRVMADAEGADVGVERFLLDWQRKMIMEAAPNEAPREAVWMNKISTA